jgi:hypothetical protein
MAPNSAMTIAGAKRARPVRQPSVDHRGFGYQVSVARRRLCRGGTRFGSRWRGGSHRRGRARDTRRSFVDRRGKARLGRVHERHVDRQLPQGLSDAQRYALLEFFAGHLSAGQLTKRLGFDDAGRAQASPKPERHPSRVATASLAVRDRRDHREEGKLLGLTRAFTYVRRSHDPAVGDTSA